MQHNACFVAAAACARTAERAFPHFQALQRTANDSTTTPTTRLRRVMLYSGSLTLLLVHSAAFAPPPRKITTKTARIHRAVSAAAEDAPMLYKAIGESTRFAVSGAVAATLLVRRDAETLTWVAGAILAAVCNKILKRIIKEDRPEAGDDGGMPSSHACSVCHLGVGAALRFPLTKLQIGGSVSYTHLTLPTKA